MAEIVLGGAEAIAGDPVIFANVNVNSPLHFDVAHAGGDRSPMPAPARRVIVTPFLLMGAMAPVSCPAALVQQTTEVLAGVALVQLVRPGTPCVMGSFLSATDMQTGSPSFGGPESAFGLHASGPDRPPSRTALAVGRRHAHREPGDRLPGRLRVDQHAESPPSWQAPTSCWQSAGWLEGGLVTSLEKFVADCELIDLMLRQFTPVEVDEASLAFGAHVEVGHGGHFFGAEHTLERFRECFWRPTVATTENIDRWTRGGALDHAARAERALSQSCSRPTSGRRSTTRSRPSWSSSWSGGRRSWGIPSRCSEWGLASA